MFTGIVQGIAHITQVVVKDDHTRLSIEFPPQALSGIEIGASVSISGCCLTVVAVAGTQLQFDLVHETLRRTTLGSLAPEAPVNFERSLKFGDEIGGHLLSGHVDTVVTVVSVKNAPETKEVTFAVDPHWMKFIFSKGYVALNGASLTVVEVNRESATFSVALIPETLARTTFSSVKVGDRLNIEIDKSTQVIVETIERIMKEREQTPPG